MIIQELGKKLLLIVLLFFCLGTSLPPDESAVFGELPFFVQTQVGKVCEARQGSQQIEAEIKNSPAKIRPVPQMQTVVRTVVHSLLLPRFYQSAYFHSSLLKSQTCHFYLLPELRSSGGWYNV